jgi:hypothetical protein
MIFANYGLMGFAVIISGFGIEGGVAAFNPKSGYFHGDSH